MTFSISALVSARDSHMKADGEAGVLIPGTIWKSSCHNLFITYFTFTFSRIDFYITEKIVAPTNCENKSLRELLLLESGFKKISNTVDLYNDVKKCL